MDAADGAHPACGLKTLPTDILEAAAVDGANGPQRFWLMVLPLLLPAAFLALILRMMDAFRVFDIIFVTTGGGPADATNTLMIYGVKQGLEFFNIGAASPSALDRDLHSPHGGGVHRRSEAREEPAWLIAIACF